MWFEELGPILTPVLAGLAAELKVQTLAIWILREDGRHFLEESPPSHELFQAFADGIHAPPFGREEGFESAYIADPEDPADRELVLEAVHPHLQRPPIGFPRALPVGSELFRFLDPAHEPVGMVGPLEGMLPDGLAEGRPGWWAARLEGDGQIRGVIAFPIPETAEGDVPSRFLLALESQSWRWDKLRAEAALARRTATLEAVQAVGNTITSQLEIHDVLQSVVEQATVLMRAKTASLMLVNSEGDQLVLESIYGASPDYLRNPSLDIATSLIGSVVRTGRPVVVRDVRTCQGYVRRELAKSEGLVSLLSVPIKWRESVIGALNVYSARRYRYNEDGVYLLSMLASQCAIAIQNARTVSQAKILEEQVHDLDKRSLVGELAAGVAHEIRNPLAVVKMLIDSWESRNDAEREDIEVITSQLHGINRCVSQLLEIARPQPVEFTPVDLRKQVTNILQLLRVRLRDQGTEVFLDLPENLPPLRADASRFRQMLMNILLNALNVMPQGGRIAVRASVMEPWDFSGLPGDLVVAPPDENLADWSAGPAVMLSLSDTGGGLHTGDSREIFVPFRTHTSGGFGLGLSIVKRIVEDHQAGLKVHNKPGEGLEFELLFPGAG